MLSNRCEWPVCRRMTEGDYFDITFGKRKAVICHQCLREVSNHLFTWLIYPSHSPVQKVDAQAE